MNTLLPTATLTALCLGCFIIPTATAADTTPVYFENVVIVAGTGCPNGSATISGQQTQRMQVRFGTHSDSRYDVGKKAVSGQSRRASCSFATPVNVPQGYRITSIKARWQGVAKGKNQLKRKYFFAGQPGRPWLTSTFKSSTAQEYKEYDTLPVGWSACGRDVNLRINSNIRASSSSSSLRVDKVSFKLKMKKCS